MDADIPAGGGGTLAERGNVLKEPSLELGPGGGGAADMARVEGAGRDVWDGEAVWARGGGGGAAGAAEAPFAYS